MKKTLSQKLNKEFSESYKLFEDLNTFDDVSDFLEIPKKYLWYLLYIKKNIYTSFTIPKKTGGVRKINKPTKNINILQKKLLPFLEAKYKIKKPVHGFVKNKSILTNAKEHLKKNYILNLDIKNFFPTINFGRVRGLFMSEPFNMGEDAATLIAQLCCYNNELPQGACTSPVISNLIAVNLDNRMMKLSQNIHCTYTRYADDITISSSKPFPKTIIFYNEGKNPFIDGFEIGKKLTIEIEKAGFEINTQKVRLENKYVRQEVTGLTINSFPNVKRKYIRQIRAMLYSFEKDGLLEAEKKHLAFKGMQDYKGDIPGKYFQNVLIGKLAFLKMIRGIDDEIVQKLCLNFAKLTTEELPQFIKDIKMESQEYEVFICHASEDKEKIAIPIYNELESLSIKVFLDQNYIRWGDSFIKIIDHALKKSKFVIAILSENSIDKRWPLKEIHVTLARQIAGDDIKLLPIVVGNEQKTIKQISLISDILYKKWDNNAKEIADEIHALLKNEILKKDFKNNKTIKQKILNIIKTVSKWCQKLTKNSYFL